MKKSVLLFLIIISTIFTCGCNKTNSSNRKNHKINYEDAQPIMSQIAETYYDQILFDGVYTVEDAYTFLYWLPDEYNREEISEEDLQKAICKMLEFYDNTREYFRKMNSGDLLEDIKGIY